MDADPGVAFARFVERKLVAARLVASFECGNYALTPGQRTPGWIIRILDPDTLRLTWHAERNRAYQRRKLGMSVNALRAAGLHVAEHNGDDGHLERLIVTRAAPKAAP